MNSEKTLVLHHCKSIPENLRFENLTKIPLPYQLFEIIRWGADIASSRSRQDKLILPFGSSLDLIPCIFHGENQAA
jgi:hypothetical protein